MSADRPPSGGSTPDLRCLVTGNPCGTDTWTVGRECQCESCQTWLAWSRVDTFCRKRIAGPTATILVDLKVIDVALRGRSLGGGAPDEPPHSHLHQAWPWVVYTTAYGLRIRHELTGTELDLYEAARKLNDYDRAWRRAVSGGEQT